MCSSKQSTSGNGSVRAIDNDAALSGVGNFANLCQEILFMLEQDFEGNGIGFTGDPIKCNQYTQGKNTVNEEIADFACYDNDTGAGEWWKWEDGSNLGNGVAC